MKTASTTIILIFFCFIFMELTGQNRWTNIFYSEKSAVGNDLGLMYDNGYLLIGKHGHNAVNYNWLIKTDVNGSNLWEKTVGFDEFRINLKYIDSNSNGDIFFAGSTNLFDEQKDAVIIKLNACMEKEWCRILYIPDVSNYARDIIALEDGSCIATLYNSEHYKTDHLCLIKLDAEGEFVWYNCLNSQDTSLSYPLAKHILSTQDNGFLISGDCYYKDPNPPNLSWIKPYYVKTDSLGNIEWETVIHSDLGGEAGGTAWSTTLDPAGLHYYSSISHYYPGNDIAPTLVKMNLDGSMVGIYDLNSTNTFGGLSHATFINDSVLAGGAGWGTSPDDVVHHAVLIDTVGNVFDSLPLIQDFYWSISRVTSEERLLYMYNTYQSGQFDVYLTKLNYNLESDTINPFPFNYDSLCPYQILSDTIPMDDCGLIVGLEEVEHGPGQIVEKNSMVVYPNPARSEISWQLTVGSRQWVDECACGCVVEVWDLFGRKVEAKEVPPGQTELKSDVSGWPPGIYISILRNDRKILARRKFVVAR